MSNVDLTKPSRQNIAGLILVLINSLRSFFSRFFPLLIIFIFKKDLYNQYKTTIILGAIAIVILLIINAILYYLNFWFYIEGDQFVLRKGYINKKNIQIPLDRIQSINIKQNVVQRFLKIVSLEIDTAGSANKEVKIIALKKEQADEIKQYLLYNKQNNDTTDEAEENIKVEEVSEDEEVTKLTVSDLIKVAFSSNMFKAGLIVTSTLYGFYDRYKSYITSHYQDQLDNIEQTFDGSAIMPFVMLLLLFVVVSVIVSLISTVVKYYDLSFVKNQRGFQIICGLLNRRQIFVPRNKIQIYSYTINPVRRLFDIVTVKIKQASGNDVKEKNAISIPGCKTESNRNIIDTIFTNAHNQDYSHHKVSSYYFIRLWFIMALLPMITVPWFIQSYTLYAAIIGFVVWFIPVSVMVYLASKKRGIEVSEDYMILQSGAISTERKIVELYKIQSVKYRQSVFMKRRGVASLQFVTASGNITVPFINSGVATDLYNYTLYKIQTTNKEWM
ncbi:MAG: PH domain-containing protein [Bacteroidales bacterium]|jgi:putative membrane protein|nr:PH domain-containing protein [Bacteroidales bacterium]